MVLLKVVRLSVLYYFGLQMVTVTQCHRKKEIILNKITIINTAFFTYIM